MNFECAVNLFDERPDDEEQVNVGPLEDEKEDPDLKQDNSETDRQK